MVPVLPSAPFRYTRFAVYKVIIVLVATCYTRYPRLAVGYKKTLVTHVSLGREAAKRRSGRRVVFCAHDDIGI